jgi:hypothetical protein
MSSSTRFLPRLHHSLNFPDGIAINYRASSHPQPRAAMMPPEALRTHAGPEVSSLKSLLICGIERARQSWAMEYVHVYQDAHHYPDLTGARVPKWVGQKLNSTPEDAYDQIRKAPENDLIRTR